MSELPNFVDLADKLTCHPSAPENFHPRHLVFTSEGLGWTEPAYAQMLDIPVFGEYVNSVNNMIEGSDLGDMIILPPNLKKLSESANVTEHEEFYLDHFRTSAVALDCLRRNNFPECPTMLKVFKNWAQTCDKLVSNPRFGDGWNLPAFFPLYAVTCKDAIDEFFELKKVSHPHLAVKMEEHRQHAMEQHCVWEGIFLRQTSPELVPFPRCLWYQKYHTIYELNLPHVWDILFGGLDRMYNVVDLTID